MAVVKELQKKKTKKTRTKGGDRPQSPGAVKLRINTKLIFCFSFDIFLHGKNLPLFRRKNNVECFLYSNVFLRVHCRGSMEGRMNNNKGRCVVSWPLEDCSKRVTPIFRKRSNKHTRTVTYQFLIKMCCEGLVEQQQKVLVSLKAWASLVTHGKNCEDEIFLLEMKIWWRAFDELTKP